MDTTLGQRGDLADLASIGFGGGFVPKHQYVCATTLTFATSQAAPAGAGAMNTLVATFPSGTSAGAAFQTITSQAPAVASARLFGQTVFAALPAHDETGRKTCLEILKGLTTNVFVESTNLTAALSLRCTAPSEAAAKEISEEATRYVTSASLFLIPPWQEDDRRTPAECARHDAARKTYLNLQKASISGYRDPALRPLTEQMTKAQRRGDQATRAKLQEEYQRVLEAANRRALEAMKVDTQADQKLVQAFLALPPQSDYTNRQQRIETDIAPLLGRLPFKDGKADPEAARFSSHWGSITHKGREMQFYWLNFQNVFYGAPALAEWLCAQGCSNITYDFQPGGALGNEDEE